MSTQGGYPEPGEMIGPYQIGRRLGLGGMGIVFEALDSQLNRRVALKVISPQLADDEGFRGRFTREAQAQASLDSPHVVHVYAHGEVDGRLYIATQLIPDGDLGQMIQRYGAPPPATAVNVIAQVASGLADAHAAGLIHRDIKPANVLLRQRDAGIVAYLADFGIARQVDADHGLTTLGGTIGTPTYMAPELHTGSQPGVASDIYSLGCLLWSTLSGNAPYRGTSDYEIVTAHFEQPIPQLDDTGRRVQEINRVLRTAMAKQPGQRYQSAAAMRDDLRVVLQVPDEVRPAGAPATPAMAPAAPTTRSRKPIVLAVAAFLLLVGAGVGVGVALNSDGGADDPEADESSRTEPSSPDRPSVTAPTMPSLTAPTLPTAGPTDVDLTADEERAAANLTEALITEGNVPAADATCVAEMLVAGLGLDPLIEAGLLNDDLTASNQELEGQLPAEISQAVISAAVTCATATLSP